MINIFSNPYSSDYFERSNFLSYMFITIALSTFILKVISSWSSYILAEMLAYKIRGDLYRKLLNLNIAFFDESKNSPGNLSTKLQIDVQLINDITISLLSIFIEAFFNLFFGVIIAFTYSWKLAASVLFTAPLFLICAKIQEIVV